jgi:hypothetical protein
MSSVVRYTLARLGLFGAAFGLVWALGGYWLVWDRLTVLWTALVIDECQNFLNLPYGIAEILAEARGLRLSLTLAHQHLAQLPRDLREGISSNARNKIIFNVGPDDARDLARHTLPQLGEHDLAHLDAFHAAARLVHHGAETPAFTVRTRPLPPPPRRRPPGPARNT